MAPELPPRTRRILNIFLNICTELGTTSAHAENTRTTRNHTNISRNYLRARGEYSKPVSGLNHNQELPPRTRRIRPPSGEACPKLGTTSAHAENTLMYAAATRVGWNYLRARGEYALPITVNPSTWELPPRTRRIRCGFTIIRIEHGTTSAHAENTPLLRLPSPPSWNYLRARGEYQYFSRMKTSYSELPPRTRRILPVEYAPIDENGTTSAHAENT